MLSPENEDLTRRAKSLYEDRLRRNLEDSHMGEFVAIEPDSGEYFLASSVREALDAARAAHPKRRSHVLRIGGPWIARVGAVGE